MKKLFALCLAAVVALGLAGVRRLHIGLRRPPQNREHPTQHPLRRFCCAAGKDPANCKIGVIQLTEPCGS